MVVLSWSMACGETWALPVGAGVASLIIRSSSPEGGYYSATAPVRAAYDVEIDEHFDATSAHPGNLRLLAYHGALSRQARARVVARRSVKLAQLNALRRAGTISLPEYVRRFYRLPDPGYAVAVFESPVGSGA